MLEEIKNNIKIILCDYSPEDYCKRELEDLEILVSVKISKEKDGIEENMPKRTKKAYKYLRHHFVDLEFQEIEKAFFFLIITSYRYERNLEHPEIELLSFSHTAEPKYQYLQSVYELMKWQFQGYLNVKAQGIEKNKGNFLPDFTYDFTHEYWNEIYNYAKKALLSLNSAIFL